MTEIKDMLKEIFLTVFPELDEYEVDWRNRYSKEKPDNDLPYNPWTKWDEKCVKGGDGWMFNRMKDIDGEYYEVIIQSKTIKNEATWTNSANKGRSSSIFMGKTFNP